MSEITPSADFIGLVWRYPETTISSKSILVVPTGWEAYIILNGMLMDSKAEGSYTFTKDNFMQLGMFANLDPSQESNLGIEIAFLRNSMHQTKWGGSSTIQLANGNETEAKAFGSYGVKVISARTFLMEVVGSQNFDGDALKSIVNSFLPKSISTSISKKIVQENVSPVLLTLKTAEIANETCAAINENLNNYGLEIIDFSVDMIMVPN